MPLPNQPDVLIAGAGPAGLTLAAELARYQLSVRIVDQAPQPSDKSRALVVWPRTLEHLQRLHLAEAFVAAGRRGTHGRFFEHSRELACIRLDTVDSPFPFALLIPQSETERLLAQSLTAQGVTIERGVTLTSFTQSGDAVTSTLTHPDGRAETVTSRWLCAADGAHSTVRHQLNASFEGDTLTSDWILADVELAGPLDPDGIELHFFEDSILGFFPIPPNRFRVIASLTRNTAAPQGDPTLADLQALLDQRDNRGLVASHPVWLSAFHINERRVASYRHGNIFLTGDAAHIHSPAGGQGMNTGMQDAFNLAWKLALVQKNSGNAGLLLDSYHAERSPVAAQVLKGSGFLTRMGTLENPLLRSVRNQLFHFLFGFHAAQHFFAENASELAVHYPHTPLNFDGRKTFTSPAPGQRAPIRSNEGPVSTGSTPQFTVYADIDPADTGWPSLLARFPQLLAPNPRPPFHLHGLWLVRPDGYIAVATLANQWHDLETYLTHLTQDTPKPTIPNH